MAGTISRTNVAARRNFRVEVCSGRRGGRGKQQDHRKGKCYTLFLSRPWFPDAMRGDGHDDHPDRFR